MSMDDAFKRVSPEAYNRMRDPSLKQHHEFVKWLREATVMELESTRGDIGATKAVFIRFFQRGLKADLLLGELMDVLPSVVTRADYAETEHSQVVSMLKSLNLEELRIECNQRGTRSNGPSAEPCAPPNVDPATSSGSSEASERPPSVS